MKIGIVKGTVVSTQKDDSLIGCKLLVVSRLNADGSPIGEDEVAIDIFGAGIGEKVLLCAGSSARSLFDNPKTPVDLVVVGIIDSLET